MTCGRTCRLRLSSFWLCLTLYLGLSLGDCFYPNGEISDGDLPCDPDAETSACCASGFGNSCLSNKLCQGSDGNIIRGSCTDKNWESPDCPSFCLTANNGGTDLISCANVTDADTSYCCDHMPNCCNSGIGRFNVLPESPDIWAGWSRNAREFSVVGSMFEDTATTTSSPTFTSSSSTQPLETTPNTGSEVATIENPKPTNPTKEEEDDGTSLSTGAMAGIGVGAGMGALLIAIIGFLLWKLRRGKSSQPQGTQPNTQHWNQQAELSSEWKNGFQKQASYVHNGDQWGHGVSELPARSVTRQSRPYELGVGS